MWAVSDALSDDEKSDAYMAIAENYIPFIKNAKAIAKAHTRFRVRDRRAST